MSVDNAKKFLEELKKESKLQMLLENVSLEDIEQALEENRLDDVSGGFGACVPVYWN